MAPAAAGLERRRRQHADRRDQLRTWGNQHVTATGLRKTGSSSISPRTWTTVPELARFRRALCRPRARNASPKARARASSGRRCRTAPPARTRATSRTLRRQLPAGHLVLHPGCDAARRSSPTPPGSRTTTARPAATTTGASGRWLRRISPPTCRRTSPASVEWQRRPALRRHRPGHQLLPGGGQLRRTPT